MYEERWWRGGEEGVQVRVGESLGKADEYEERGW